MYLVLCSKIIKNKFNQLFGKNMFYGNAADFVIFSHIVPQVAGIKFLEQNINNYDYVVFVSPSCIDLANEIIKKAIKPNFLVMGISSYIKLKSLTNKKILYPSNDSGMSALIREVIIKNDFAKNSRYLLVKGNDGNVALVNELLKIGVECNIVEIYNRMILQDTLVRIKNLLHIKRYDGIILTSSLQVDWLFQQMDESEKALLKQMRFYTWHAKINIKLKLYGVLKVIYIPNPLIA